MSFIPTGFAQVVLEYTSGGPSDPVMNSFGVDNSVSGFTSQAIATLVEANWVANLQGITPDEYTLTHILVTPGPTGATATFDHTLAPPLAGGAAISPLPPNNAVLVTKVTARPGRSGRGRWFLPPANRLDVNPAGIITPALVSVFQAAVTGFRADLVTDGIPMVLLHTSPLVSPDAVTALSVNNLIGTIGRRVR